jgi:DNA-binding MarR family transcriptional regulator
MTEKAKVPSSRAIAVKILKLMPAIMRTVGSELRRDNPYLTPSHLGVLGILSQRPCSLSQLSEILAVSLPTMSNSVSTFVKRGWVKRKHAADDRRFIRIELTAAGRKRLEDVLDRVELRLTAQLAPLPKAKRQGVDAALTLLQGIYELDVATENRSTVVKTNGTGRKSNNSL